MQARNALPWDHPENVSRRQLEWELHSAEDERNTDRCVEIFGQLYPELAPDEVEANWRRDFLSRTPIY